MARLTILGMMFPFFVSLCSYRSSEPAPPEPLPPESDELQIRVSSPTTAPADHEPVEYVNSLGMRLVLIPPGQFIMGDPGEPHWRRASRPAHPVTITRPYYIGAFEVTQAQYEAVMGTNPSVCRLRITTRPAGSEDTIQRDISHPALPVDNVSWLDAVAFCERLSQSEGQVYRLATEAEWEYAARAGSTTKWFFGSDEEQLPLYAWYHEDRETGCTHIIGTKLPNPWGLFDIYGNVEEWTRDRTDWSKEPGVGSERMLHMETYSAEAKTDPTGPEEGLFRVYRGGSFSSHASMASSTARSFLGTKSNDKMIGFRVVMEVTGDQSLMDKKR